jgi:myo-inositol 2-dehydrogenase / D-chiro-inositol 1-dehydrogenase
VTSLGVGFIGAGPVTQAIHLPALATMPEAFHVAHVMDADADLAERVASRAGAAASSDYRRVLDDPAVDVVAVCSPHQFHAAQVTAACAAGKRAVLCEKPLATSVEEADQIVGAAARSGVPVIVGTMHAYDPAWRAARDSWGDLADTVTLVRSAIYLSPNDEFVGLATELAAPPAPLPKRGDMSDPRVRAAALRGAILGLAIHNTPLVRDLLPAVDEVLDARPLAPFGYRITFRCGERTAHLLALMPGQWSPRWVFDAWGRDKRLHAEFPPSYVLAGSAVTSLGGCQWRMSASGYQAEWRHLADVVAGTAQPLISIDDSVADLRYALAIADGAAELLVEGEA